MKNQSLNHKRYAKKLEAIQVMEHGLEIECLDRDGYTILEAFSLEEEVSDSIAEVVYFESGWGTEYTPKSKRIDRKTRIENQKGRSSAEIHPQILIRCESGAIHSYAVIWSGNWVFEIEPLRDGFRIHGGLSDREFAKRLAFGEKMVAPSVVSVISPSGSLNEIGNRFNAWCEQTIPRNALSESLPVEWNHWWAYEDRSINEETFLSNVDLAGDLGIEVCTLDAGWFGSDDEAEHWYGVRGDWHKANRKRFPNGIRFLSDYVHGKGMKFGLWCEIEGLGVHADLCETHPQFVAKREDGFLGTQRRTGKTVMVGHQMRWDPLVLQVRAQVERGELGRIYTAKTGWYRRKGIPGWGTWFTQHNQSGGGPLIDIGVHMLDLAFFLMGEPKPVSVYGSTYAEFGPRKKGIGSWGKPNWNGTYDVEDLATAIIKMEDGTSLTMEVSWAVHMDTDSAPFVHLMGSEGGVSLNGNKGKFLTERFDQTIDIDFEAPQEDEGDRGRLSRHFLECVLEGKTPWTSAETGLRSNLIIDAIYESSRSGGEMKLDWSL